MKTALLVLPLVLLLACASVHAQPVDPASGAAADAERSRIQAERDKVEERFARDEAACYQKFSVSDCLIQARTARRELISDLRRQELSLNAADARRRGAEQLSRIEEKSSPQAFADEAARRAQALEDQKERQRVFDDKSVGKADAQADRAARLKESGDKTKATQQKQSDRASKAQEASAAKKSYETKLKDAQAREAQRQKRLAEPPKTPPTRPLPTPAPVP